jgi:hypothetical protein
MIHPLGILNLVTSILLFQVALKANSSIIWLMCLGTILAVIAITFGIIRPHVIIDRVAQRVAQRVAHGLNNDGELLVELFVDVGGPHVVPRAPSHKGTDVHDHAVQTSIVAAIRALQQRYPQVIGMKQFDDLKKYIFNGYDGDYKKKEGAYSTLRYMERNSGRCTEVNLSDLDILSLVWARINDTVNKDVASELKSNLVESLAEASITVDNPYCLTGRVTRMVQSLESLDAEQIVNIKSTETFFKEHPALLSIYTEDKLDESTAQVLERLRAYVTKTLTSEYVEAGLVLSTEFERIMAPLLEAL